ncbi:release factor glutamine methyltransferase [Philodulcilactobacillus myokoensis]|uniref:peptide chain release factor N(5)-glutamine methyltransferase n=1 Tax=Philodulcilactobacillus myokoensis TaxID=2929573 RepID=A0A9W6B269_9LACO|nr:peptide chain release factor N(5)-glutamine methyltransferase [Philodulcilactobacillus myokoensis]GLB47085.1 release factor glutamine methyltransferase [Philodulcilactobacillus myokoensis]
MSNQITFFQARKKAANLIRVNHLDPDVARYLLCEQFHFSNTDLLMHNRTFMSNYQKRTYFDGIKRFLNGEPPQYIIGHAPFYGYDFFVNRHVLIPRMETEELVDWLLKSFDNRPLKVIDIGTGSGAIAIALKLKRNQWSVYASDISQPALNVAEQNAKKHHADIQFLKSDLFNQINVYDFDIVISNPPYVAHNEIKYMDQSVLNHEPNLALFAQNNGLAIYQKLAKDVQLYTKKHANIFLEIGFKQRYSVNQIFKQYLPKAKIENKNDISNHPRMVRIIY